MRLTVLATNKRNRATGYGRMEIGLERGLRDCGVDVSDKVSDGVNILVGHPKWAVKYTRKRTARLWAYTMSESNRVSESWVHCLNSFYERVLVPAPELVEIYRRSGVIVPVHFVPLGVDYAPLSVVKRPRYPDPFVFLAYSLGDTRKAAELSMFAFKKLFGGQARFKMVVKCRDNPNWLSGLEDDQITIVRGEMEDADWHELLMQCHAFVFPSRGEGFGLPPREAVLTGMPTISGSWLGLWDAECWGYPVKIAQMQPALFDFWEANAEGALWAEPDQDSLEHHLRYVVDNYEAALARTQRGRVYLLNNFTWSHTAQKIKALLDESE